MKNILMISPCDLPIPAVKGGAVSTLIESLVKENSLQGKVNIELVSIYDETAQRISKKYKNTKFIWIKLPKIIKKLDAITDGILQKLKIAKKPKEYFRKLYVINKTKKILEKKCMMQLLFRIQVFYLRHLKKLNY